MPSQEGPKAIATNATAGFRVVSPDDEAEAEPQDSADDEEDGDDFPDSLWSGIEEDEEFANLSPEIKARMREILRASEPGQNGTEFPENGIE